MNNYLSSAQWIFLWARRGFFFGVIAIAYSCLNSVLASNICRQRPLTPANSNTATFQLNNLQPYYSVPIGGVLGTASLQTELTCFSNSEYNFILQIEPRSTSERGIFICNTPLDGVGIRYKNFNGADIRCDSWGEVFRIPRPRTGGAHNFGLPVAAEFIRTKEVTALPPGQHTLAMPARARILSHLNGGTSSIPWGRYVFNNSLPLMVSRCTFAASPPPVNFERFPIEDILIKNVPFEININNCGNTAGAQVFNNAMNFQFIASNILPNGTLNNQPCFGCARNLAIEVTNDNGATIPLNQNYPLRNGTFSINGGTITHRFRAKLRPHGGTVTSGRINTLMTVVFSSI